MHYIDFWKKDEVFNDCLYVSFNLLFWFAVISVGGSGCPWEGGGDNDLSAICEKFGWSGPYNDAIFMCPTYHSHTGKISWTKNAQCLSTFWGHLLYCKSMEKNIQISDLLSVTNMCSSIINYSLVSEIISS